MESRRPDKLWESICQGLVEHLPESSFREWILPCRPLALEKDTLILEVPSLTSRLWIEQQLTEELNDALVQADASGLKLRFQLQKNSTHPTETSHRSREVSPKSKSTSKAPPISFPALFHRYTLDRFVVGSNSQLAYAAAQAVVQHFGEGTLHLSSNPLFIYGGVGLGKTHLMVGIGKSILDRHPGTQVAYLKVDSFFHELTNAISQQNTEPLREKYQKNDILLLDDVQTLIGKTRTQEEIFYILESLLQNGKQIVITSDNPPRKLDGLHERLITRCAWGLIVDIQPPDFETRIAILKKKLEDPMFSEMPPIPQDVLVFIAHRGKGSVRELEGLLTRIVTQASLLGIPVSLELAHSAFQSQSGEEATISIPLERIYRMTAETFGLNPSDLKKKSRLRQFLLPRQVAMYLARELTGASLSEIGGSFNDMHHSSVLNAIESVKIRMKRDPDFHKQVTSLLNSIH